MSDLYAFSLTSLVDFSFCLRTFRVFELDRIETPFRSQVHYKGMPQIYQYKHFSVIFFLNIYVLFLQLVLQNAKYRCSKKGGSKSRYPHDLYVVLGVVALLVPVGSPRGKHIYSYCDVPISPCLSKTGPVYGPSFLNFGGLLLGQVLSTC